jgi:hypothetical protein
MIGGHLNPIAIVWYNEGEIMQNLWECHRNSLKQKLKISQKNPVLNERYDKI